MTGPEPVDISFETYRTLLARCPDPILLVEGGRITTANAAAATLFGGDASHLVGAPLERAFAPPSRPLVEQLLHTASDDVPVWPRAALQVTRQDGSARDVEVVVSRLGDVFYLTIRDVSDSRQLLRELRDSEERLRLAFAGAQEGVWDWDLDTGAVVYSSRWKEMLGYDEDDIEPHVGAWERLIHPDDKAPALAAVGRVAQGDTAYRVECRLRHKAGHYVHILSRGYPVRRPEDGRVIRIVGTHLDLTERKQAELALRESEERLTLAFAGAQEGVWDWNLETGAVVYSRRWKTMLGYDDAEIEPHVSAWERLLHPDDRARADAVNRGVMEGRPSYEAEFRLRHKDGHYVHVLSRGLPIRGADGRVARIVGTHFDLSERKQAEDALRHAHEALEHRVRERTAELARANQSLMLEMRERERAERARTDLLSRLVFAQEDERRRIAREMHDQFGEHLTALSRAVERLMAFAAVDPQLAQAVTALDIVTQRLDRDVEHLVWELRPTALDDLGLRAALSNYAKDWSARTGVPVQMHTAGLMNDRLPRDVETTLYRIAQEALTNIAKHARATHVEVLLERRADAVVLAIEDNGVGFDRETPSDRGASTGASADAERSFGLLGMQERAALIGASLSIESSVGEGTSVLFRMTADALSAKPHG